MTHTLYTVFVTHNRLELTKRTLASYVDTVTLPYRFVVVDNGSTDGTEEWLKDNVDYPGGYVLLQHNYYPGKAANIGWATGGDEATLLHRSDNDIEYLPGWCDEVVERFKDPELGQLGLRTVEEEGNYGNVGGNCVIRREAWDAGARYDERPWTQFPFEDGAFSHLVKRRGYNVVRAKRPCVVHIGIASSDEPYYQQTFADRRITFAEWGIE